MTTVLDANIHCVSVDGVRLFGFRQKFSLEDAIGSHACSVEALASVWLIAFLSGVHSSYRLAL
jgi:hypothetical protein